MSALNEKSIKFFKDSYQPLNSAEQQKKAATLEGTYNPAVPPAPTVTG